MSVHVDIANLVLDDILDDPASAKVYAETRRKIRDGRLAEEQLAPIGQTLYGPKSWGPEQVACWLAVHADLMGGRFAEVRIEVGAEPGADGDRRANAEKLEDLPAPFTAHVDLRQNGGDQDGSLTWSEPIRVSRSTGKGYEEDGQTFPYLERCLVPPRCVPLEIGTTLPSRTRLHMDQDSGVARWPYGSPFIFLMVKMKNGIEIDFDLPEETA